MACKHTPPVLLTSLDGPQLAHGEPFLTIRQFHTLLRSRHIPGSLRSVYRWLDIPKEHLPTAVQLLLPHAPSLWFLQVQSTTATIAIPLRYLDTAAQDVARPDATPCVEPHVAVRTVRALKAALEQMQDDLARLEQFVEAIHGKDAPDAYGTARHTLTA